MISNPLGRLFGRSPLSALQRHMEKAQECASEFLPFFDATLAGDWERAEAIQLRIQHLEREADQVKKEIRNSMRSGLLIPVNRSDVLELLRMQDKIANRVRDIAGLMLGRRMVIPAQLAGLMREFVVAAVSTAAQALNAIEELDELLETVFAGRETAIVHAMISEVEALEEETDRLEVQVRAELFALESELPPVNVIFLYDIISWIGEVADVAQRVGGRLEQLIAG